MPRKIKSELIKAMKEGELALLFNHIKSEPRLRLEVRTKGQAFVYYKKGKILELDTFKIDKGYLENLKAPYDIEYQATHHPEKHFEKIISEIDNWLHNKRRPRAEFETQQNIARDNQDKNDQYIILDMEYCFSRKGLKKSDPDLPKRAAFDLLGIERQTGKIVFFEVKKGGKSLSKNSGIAEHIIDFEKYIHGMHSDMFFKNLIEDINNIISDKHDLGLIDKSGLCANFAKDKVELIFVYEPVNGDKNKYLETYNNEHTKSGSKNEYHTIYVSNDNFKLRKK